MKLTQVAWYRISVAGYLLVLLQVLYLVIVESTTMH